ncbi:MAG: tetratricopeptide repeat protein [Candidimonas sp.]
MKEIPLRVFNAATPERFSEVMNGSADEAARWVLTAAEHGVAEAQTHYARMLLDGIGVEPNPGDAFQWFKLAANQNHVMAMNMLGRCYENGWGVEPDMLLATYWFKQAADRGLDWGMYNYATSLALGRGTAIDRESAYAWLRKAAGMGHAKSWNLLGGFHEDGWVVGADLDAAIDCYRKAAEGGDFRGQFNYARLLADTTGDMRASTHWMRCAYSAANPPFRTKMTHYLKTSPHPEFSGLSLS